MARKRKAVEVDARGGNVIEMGDIVCVDPMDDKPTKYRRCLLIEFPSEEAVKAAVEARRAEFTIFGD